MAGSTFVNELYHSGSNTFAQELLKGRRPNKRHLDMHAVRGYAESKASAGQGAVWRIQIPALIWARGQSFGSIQSHPGNPGCSYLIEGDFLLRYHRYLRIDRAD